MKHYLRGESLILAWAAVCVRQAHAAILQNQGHHIRGAGQVRYLHPAETSSVSEHVDFMTTYLRTLHSPVPSMLENRSDPAAGGDDQGVSEAPGAEAGTDGAAEATMPRHQVVVAKYDEDVGWLHELPRNLDVVVYQSNDSHAPHFVENVGNEASKYLTYIVENYESLPDTVAFMQAGRTDWHDPFPKDVMLQRWDWRRAAANGGFDFFPSAAPCLIEDSNGSTTAIEAVAADEQEDPGRKRRRSLVSSTEMCGDVVEHSPPQMETLKSVWPDVFESELGSLPKHWFTQCCAQFQVTRDAIQQHPLQFYQQLLQWVMDHDRSLLQSDTADEMKRNHDETRRDAGHVLEVTWALIFSTPSHRMTLD